MKMLSKVQSKLARNGASMSASLFLPLIGLNGKELKRGDMFQYPSTHYYFSVEVVKDVAREEQMPSPALEILVFKKTLMAWKSMAKEVE